MAPAGEEATSAALGKSREYAGSTPDGASAPSAAVQPELVKITRATMALRVEPWRLLAAGPSREAHARGHGGDQAARAACPACQLLLALHEVQRECAGAYNYAARALERADGQFWDAAKLAAGGGKLELPTRQVPGKSGGPGRVVIAWPSDQINLYEQLRLAFPVTVAGTMSAVASEVFQKWRQERWSVLSTMERSAARWKRETTPIPLRAADCELRALEARDSFELHCTLRGGRRARSKEFVLPIAAKDGRQYRDLREIARCCAGEPSAFSKMGALEVKRDRLGKHWELRLAYSRLVPRAAGEEKLGAINRGLSCIVALADEGGYSYVYDGHDIEAYLQHMQRRRRQYQNSLKFSGRGGRGRARALQPTEVLEGRATRWRKDKLQRIARQAARWFQDRGVTRVLLDDLTGIRDGSVDSLDGGKPVWDRIQQWPYFELGVRLKACLDELGIAHDARPVAFGSRDCPACDHRHEERQCSRTFKCAACGYSRHIDVTFALNLIARERSRGESAEAAESRRKQEAATDPRRTSRKAGAKLSKSLTSSASRRNGEGDES